LLGAEAETPRRRGGLDDERVDGLLLDQLAGLEPAQTQDQHEAVAIPRALFVEILRLIDRLRPAPMPP
jgi:hypothetical protein